MILTTCRSPRKSTSWHTALRLRKKSEKKDKDGKREGKLENGYRKSREGLSNKVSVKVSTASSGACAPQEAIGAGPGPGGVTDLVPCLAQQRPASLCPVSRPKGLWRGSWGQRGAGTLRCSEQQVRGCAWPSVGVCVAQEEHCSVPSEV